MIKCCQNCANRIDSPKNNRYGDIDHFCMVTGYFISGLNKDITKVKRFSPGGKELNCQWKPLKCENSPIKGTQLQSGKE